MSNDDTVGYRKPPKATQFKKGQSGNPHGRPPKIAGRNATAARVLSEVQRIAGPKGTRVRFTTLEVIILTMKQMAAAGHLRASALYSRFASRFGRQDSKRVTLGYLIVPEDTATIEEWEELYSPKEKPPGYLEDEG